MKLESFLGNVTRVPVPVSKSSRLPSSFDEVNTDYREAKSALDRGAISNLNMTAEAYRNKVKDSPAGNTRSSAIMESPARSDFIRNEINHNATNLKEKAREHEQRFEAEKVGRTKNNHVSTERSLFNSVNEQVKDDPDIVSRKLKELFDKIETKWK